MTTTYRDRLTQAMTLAAQHGALMLGQAIAYPGTAMTGTFADVPQSQLIEMPVAEDLQLGMSIGLSLQSNLPVLSVYPRINFLMCAMNQLVLHLDAIPRYSDGGYLPHVIIRTAVATDHPLNPGEQHLSDYTVALRHLLKTVEVVPLKDPRAILPAYRDALAGPPHSTILVEYSALYDEVA